MPPSFAVPPPARASFGARLGELALELAEIFAVLIFLAALALVADALTGGV
ncbi:MAG: hypothetical protein KGL39_55850 [Patescibacteria group bacterium]|nr:hypothetical protein [Patescibacteria group bacterium]